MHTSKQIVICPDSFKGTLPADVAAEIIERAVNDAVPSTKTFAMPIADGGEGTLDCFRRALSGRIIGVQTRNANFRPCNATYLLTPQCAVIESAKAIGLASTEFRNPARTTSYGVGLMMADALKRTKSITLALGGSSTNDAGAGIAAALGAVFYDDKGNPFVPTGGTLINVNSIDISAIPPADVTCMCDVDNPLYGERGAAYVFSPQKGADYAMVKKLDDGLKHFADVIKRDVGSDVSEIPGGGAAGGIAAGLVAFCGAKLKSGIDIMLDLTKFDDLLGTASMVVTGEGRLDSQSTGGKAISGIVRRAAAHNVPVIAICGQIEPGFDLEKSGLSLAIATSPFNTPLSPGRNYAKELYDTAYNLFAETLKKQ